MNAQELCQSHQDEAFEKLAKVLSNENLEQAKSFYQILHRAVTFLLSESAIVIQIPIGVSNILLVQELVLSSCQRFAAMKKEEFMKEISS